MAVRVGAALWIVAALAYVVAELTAAAAMPGYDYARDYVSTLGQPGRSPLALPFNAAFVTQGVCFSLGALLLSRGVATRKALWFLIFAVLNGVGNLVVAIIHSGAGSAWHVVGAVLAIGCGNAAVVVGTWTLGLGRAWRWGSAMLGGIGLLCLVLVGLKIGPIGAWERVGVYVIFVWQVAAAVTILRASVRQLAAAPGVSRADTHARGSAAG